MKRFTPIILYLIFPEEFLLLLKKTGDSVSIVKCNSNSNTSHGLSSRNNTGGQETPLNQNKNSSCRKSYAGSDISFRLKQNYKILSGAPIMIYFLNVQGLHGKIDNFNQNLFCAAIEYDIIVFSETWFDYSVLGA